MVDTTTVSLTKAIAELSLANGTDLTKAMIKIYLPGAFPGSWNQTESIKLTSGDNASNKILDPVVVENTNGGVKRWTMEWGLSAQTVPRNANIKIEIITTTKQGTNAEVTSVTSFAPTTATVR